MPAYVSISTRTTFTTAHKNTMEGQSQLIDFRVSASLLEELTNKLLEDYNKTLDDIGALKGSSNITVENTLRSMHAQDGEAAALSAKLTLPAMVSTDKDVRDVSNKSKNRLYDFWSNIYSLREDVYLTLKQLEQKVAAGEASLPTNEDKRILDKTLKLFERNGLSLPAEKRSALVELRTQASELSNLFQKRVNEDVTVVPFTKEDLEGCEPDFIASLTQKEMDGTLKYLVGMKVKLLINCLNNLKLFFYLFY